MAPFTFPDPSVSTSVTNPKTGELWIYVDGVWMVDDTEDAPLPTPDPSPTPTPTVPSDEITQLRTEIAALQADIIELRAQLVAATVNNFLILE